MGQGCGTTAGPALAALKAPGSECRFVIPWFLPRHGEHGGNVEDSPKLELFGVLKPQ